MLVSSDQQIDSQDHILEKKKIKLEFPTLILCFQRFHFTQN